ncbi:glycine cleavage system aminomethyltransferase GcvT [Kitasatospora sp. NPDC048365]|uniref:glycine cleavage system aminomethyltransferase GcvT n=1 Tax=Kitasatospora sp. NPDC048365 TaxID=3364050 RepID=UPI003714EB85
MSKKSPLYDIHRELGAAFADVAGWSMPLRYSSELAEHHAVRTAVGLFDLSHLGKIEVFGPEAGRALDHALVGEPSRTPVGQSRYSVLVHESGGILDDVVVHRVEASRYLIVCSTVVVCPVLRDRVDGFAVTLQDATNDWALLALHGPAAAALVDEVAEVDTSRLPRHTISRARLQGMDVLLSRTGGTGEDGFEIYCSPGCGPSVWRALTLVGSGQGLAACGLASRDMLRLEAGVPAQGRELTVRVTPFEAGLGNVVAFDKRASFVGDTALRARRGVTPSRSLVGLTTAGPTVPRSGHRVLDRHTREPIGEITSGEMSPTLGHPVAMAYLRAHRTEPGTEVLVEVGAGREEAVVTLLPFYRRSL